MAAGEGELRWGGRTYTGGEAAYIRRMIAAANPAAAMAAQRAAQQARLDVAQRAAADWDAALADVALIVIEHGGDPRQIAGWSLDLLALYHHARAGRAQRRAELTARSVSDAEAAGKETLLRWVLPLD